MAKKSDDKTDLYKKFVQPVFFGTGCTVLDKAMGGGYAKGRIINIIGDSSTGKTLYAIIACKLYNLLWPKEFIEYIEAERAFNPSFALSLGLPEENVMFPSGINTIEKLFDYFTKKAAAGKPGLVIVDSLDALSTEEELAGEFQQAYMGAKKANQMSELFRRVNEGLEAAGVTVIIISQTRDKLGVIFGRTWTRAGGNALKFYSSQILVLMSAGKLMKTVSGIKRAIGTMTKTLVDKNKLGPQFREADVPILFEQGIDDYRACILWLKKLRKEVPEGTSLADVQAFTSIAWDELEAKFRDTAKYDETDEKGEPKKDDGAE